MDGKTVDKCLQTPDKSSKKETLHSNKNKRSVIKPNVKIGSSQINNQ